MQTGKMRHRITIQQPVVGTNPFQTSGEGSWADVLTVWARIESPSARDIYSAGLQNMQITHVVTIRYPGTQYVIGAGYQLLYGTRVFDVQKGIINEEERNRQLQLLVFEINPVQ